MDPTTKGRRALLVLAGSMALAGCQASGEPDAGTAPAQTGTVTSAADDAPPASTSGRGTARLTIGDQPPLTAEVTCVLQPEGEMLFYATSTSQPSFGLTVFAANAPRAEVDWVGPDQTWYGSPDVVAMLDGNVISGTGSFSAEGDGADEQLGTFAVDCAA